MKFLLNSYLFGIVLILTGIFVIYRLIKRGQPEWENEGAGQPYLNTWFFGLSMFVVGLLIIILKN